MRSHSRIHILYIDYTSHNISFTTLTYETLDDTYKVIVNTVPLTYNY